MAKYALDLRGIVCPLNFVKIKLKLEGLNKGDELEVLLDAGEPIKNVPRSAREEGHKIVKLKRDGEYYRVLIEKG